MGLDEPVRTCVHQDGVPQGSLPAPLVPLTVPSPAPGKHSSVSTVLPFPECRSPGTPGTGVVPLLTCTRSAPRLSPHEDSFPSSAVRRDHSPCVCPPTEGRLGGVQVWALVNRAAVNTRV